MDPIISHLIAFLVGAFGGAAGHYFGTKYTEKRHEKEAALKLKKKFKKVYDSVPDLINEMKKDINSDETGYVREFFILPNPRCSFNSSKKRFVYYEEQHKGLMEQLDLLEENGFIFDVTPGNNPVYRFTEEFVNLLKTDRKRT
jgi:hypothetical protein